MATFTNITRKKLTWQAPEVEAAGGEAYQLLIGDTYELNIGSGYNLTISPANAPTNWENTAKTKNIWAAPVQETDGAELNIGDGYELLIGSGLKLKIDVGGSSSTEWTNISKSR